MQSELWVLAARVARQVLFYEQEAVRTRLETDSTTILLRDDLEDQGALRSVVLSSTTNLQGASYGQEGAALRARQVHFMVKTGIVYQARLERPRPLGASWGQERRTVCGESD